MKSARQTKRGRGFIFTIDALFSMMLVTTIAYSFTVFATMRNQVAEQAAVHSLARDFARLNVSGNIDNNTFYANTSFQAYESAGAVPAGRFLVARAAYVYYNLSCKAKNCNDGCVISRGDAEFGPMAEYGCLTNQTTDNPSVKTKKEAWVAS
jgi:hypothetical protein